MHLKGTNTEVPLLPMAQQPLADQDLLIIETMNQLSSPSGTQLRCMWLILYTTSLETSVAPPVSEEALSTALHIIVLIIKRSLQSQTLRQTRLPSYFEDSKRYFVTS